MSAKTKKRSKTDNNEAVEQQLADFDSALKGEPSPLSEADQLRDEINQLRAENERLLEGKTILEQCLDFVFGGKGRASCYTNGSGKDVCHITMHNLHVRVDYTDPIAGILEATDRMRERLARRRVNQGV